jgi:hypothetical protein
VVTIAIGFGMILVGVVTALAIVRRNRRLSGESWSGEASLSRRRQTRDDHPGPPPSATYGQQGP